ncbi:MAG: lipopolysaccharide biosynthesis protein [Acutalibacteraceae bacterium]|jgi:O-antigen/teichoic acid export membrane protein
MNKYKTLLSNTLLISLGTFGSKILVFLMVRFYTGYLTPSDYSTADLITQTANLLFPIISVGIADGVFRFVLDKQSDKRSVFTIGFWCITLGSLLFLVIAPLLRLVKDFSGYIWLIVLYTIAACYHSLCVYYLRAIGKTALFAVQGIINTALVIILNILFLAVFKIGVTGYVLSVVLADVLCTAFLVLKERLWKAFTPHPRKRLVIPMLKYSIPLIPTTVFWWITSVSDRYMVNAMIGSDANGLYAVSYKLPTLLTLVATMFMQAWQYSALAEDDGNRARHAKFFSTVWRSFQAVMFLAGSAVIAFTKPVIKVLTAKEFYESWKYVPILAIAMIFTAFVSFTGTVYTVNKKSVLMFSTSLIGALTNIILNFLLIPSSLAVQGAAIATVASYILVFAIRCFNVRKYIPFRLYIGHIITNSLIVFLQSAVLIFEVAGWQIIEAICLVAIILINYRFLARFMFQILSPIIRRKNNV